MTAQQEVRFRCNRCGDDINVTLQNIPTTERVMRAPEGWATIWLNDNTQAPLHYCPPCAFGLKAFMDGATLLVDVRGGDVPAGTAGT